MFDESHHEISTKGKTNEIKLIKKDGYYYQPIIKRRILRCLSYVI